MERENHPAWDLYDLWRTAKLNEKYYGARINSLQAINKAMDVLIAVAAPGGTISALAFWQTQIGRAVWMILLPLAAGVGFIKPFLSLSDKIKKMEPCLHGYRMVSHDAGKLIKDMRQRQAYDAQIAEGFNEVYDRVGALIGMEPETKEKKRLVVKCFQEVEKELEKYEYYIPEV